MEEDEEELADVADDSLEMMFRAMDLISKGSFPDSLQPKVQFLQTAFQMYLTKE